MKTLSVKQPWAYLLCAGIKDIENRTWKLPVKYRGERVLIHASGAKMEGIEGDYFNEDQIGHLYCGRTPLEELHKYHSLRNQYSAIIGSVRIVDCVINHPSIWAEKSKTFDPKIDDVVPYINTRSNIKEVVITSFQTMSNGKIWFHGVDTETKAKVWYPLYRSLELMHCKPIYNWVLEDPILFEKPIMDVKGKLGFWESSHEPIICPNCGQIQCAKVENTIPFETYIHECEKCGYTIMESEWDKVK